MTKYIKVDWPEYQVFEEHERIKECYTCQVYGDNDVYSLMVPEDLYEEIQMNKIYPTEFDLPIGHIYITKDEIELNGIKYTRDESQLKRGSEVIMYSLNKGYWTTTCTSCASGFPPIFEDNSTLVDSEIVGIKNE